MLDVCWSRSHGDGLEDLAAFLNDVEMIRSEIGQLVGSAGGPANFDVGFCGVVEAEVDAEVVLREVAAAAANLVDLDEGLGVGDGLRGDG